MRHVEPFLHLGRMVATLRVDLVRFLGSSLRSWTALAAENLFLRKQLGPYRERRVKPRRVSDPMHLALVLLARCFAWRAALTIVQPATLLRWHREAFRLLWRSRSRPGHPRLPADLQRLSARMARSNPTWGEERIAAELLVKLGLRVSPRTVHRSLGRGLGGGGQGATGPPVGDRRPEPCPGSGCLRLLRGRDRDVPGALRLRHAGGGKPPARAVPGTGHPTAAWTLQQGREVLAAPHASRVVLHDRDRSYASGLDAAVTARGVRGLRTPIHAPQANALCDRRLGSLRREGLDSLIPFGEDPRRKILRAWRLHSNRGRPHSHLGPGLPDPAPGLPVPVLAGPRLPKDSRVGVRSILGGLHHAYGLEKLAA